MTRNTMLLLGICLGLCGRTATAQWAPPKGQTAAVTGMHVPAVGDVAPDFTEPWADSLGVRARPVHLADLRGKVVVLAFFPLDRSSGCTAEMHKFRDDFTSIFGADAGSRVIVLPISIDSVTTHASWARQDHFPFALVSDRDQAVARRYGSTMPGQPYNARTVFVVDRTGRITYRNLKFGALSERAYTELAAAVRSADAP